MPNNIMVHYCYLISCQRHIGAQITKYMNLDR